METNLDHIFIFKTNIREVCEDSELRHALESHPAILQWSIDTEDADCVLRIVSATLKIEAIEAIVRQHGYNCTELD